MTIAQTIEERAIAKTREYFAPDLRRWPDERVKGLSVYRKFLLQACWLDLKNAVLEALGILRLARWLQKRFNGADRNEDTKEIEVRE